MNYKVLRQNIILLFPGLVFCQAQDMMVLHMWLTPRTHVILIALNTDRIEVCEFCESCEFWELCQFGQFCEFCEFCEFCKFCEFCEFCGFCEFCDLGHFCEYYTTLPTTRQVKF